MSQIVNAKKKKKKVPGVKQGLKKDWCVYVCVFFRRGGGACEVKQSHV